MAEDTTEFVRGCLNCIVAEDRQPGRQVPLEVVHPLRRFAQVAFDVQTITPRTKAVTSRFWHSSRCSVGM